MSADAPKPKRHRDCANYSEKLVYPTLRGDGINCLRHKVKVNGDRPCCGDPKPKPPADDGTTTAPLF